MYILSQKDKAFKMKIRHFVDTEVIPVADSLTHSGAFPAELFQRCGEAGFLDFLYEAPKQQTDSALYTAIFLEEISRGLASLGLVFSPQFQGSTLLAHADESLKSVLMPDVLRGKILLAYAVDEEKSGTAMWNLEMTAQRVDDHWILNGKKCWITNAGVADGYIVLARTSAESFKRSLSFFYVKKDDPGLFIDQVIPMTGLVNSPMGHIELKNCHIPENRLIGEENAGYSLMKRTYNQGRWGIAAVATGIIQRALELAQGYIKEKKQGERLLSSNQGIFFEAGHIYSMLQVLRSLTYHTASLFQLHMPVNAECAAAKIMAVEYSAKACRISQCLQGAYGLSRQAEISRLIQDALMLEDAGGSTNASRMSLGAIVIDGAPEGYMF